MEEVPLLLKEGESKGVCWGYEETKTRNVG
jgi:hypothetical protein